MAITAKIVQELRTKTGAGIMDCKRALTETDGDIEKAVELLRKKGLASAAKRAGRITSEGLVASYIHAGGKLGVLVEVNCETDFVARSEQFQQLVKDISIHVAAANPLYLKREDVPEEVLNKDIASESTPTTKSSLRREKQCAISDTFLEDMVRRPR